MQYLKINLKIDFNQFLFNIKIINEIIMFKEFCYYLYEIHTGKESDNAKFFSALIGISFLHGMNFLSIWGIINYIFKLVIPKDSIVSLGIVLWISITLINYIFIYKKRIEITEKVKKFSSKREKIGKTFFVLYIVATFVVLFFVIENFAPTGADW